MDNAEKMAFIMADSWRMAKTKETWFQLRSWLHGAYLVEENPDVASDLTTLYEIAKEHEKEIKRV